MKLVKPKEEFITFFREMFMKRYEERKQEIKGDNIKKLQEITELETEQVWLVDKGKKGVIPDSLLQKQLAKSEQKIMLAKMSLNESYTEELEIDALLSYAEVFIRTPELAWYDAPFEAKLKYQRLMFPKGIYYHYESYSNPQLGLPFKLISDVATSQSTNVTHDFVLSNTQIDEFVRELQNWKVIFQQYPFNLA